MNILKVIYPVVVDEFADYAATVAHYREALGLPLKAEFEAQGFVVSWLGPMVVVSSKDRAALVIPRQVATILVVADLDLAWQSLKTRTDVLVPPEEVPSGGRFVVRHADGRAIEYLDLRNVAEPS